MSRAFTYVTIGVIYVISYIIHMMATALLNPDGALHKIASDGTAVMNGAARADLWFQLLSVWVPVTAVVGITAWGLVQEYRLQTQTVQRRVR